MWCKEIPFKEHVIKMCLNRPFNNIDNETLEVELKEAQNNLTKTISKFTDSFLNNAPMNIIERECLKEKDFYNKTENIKRVMNS